MEGARDIERAAEAFVIARIAEAFVDAYRSGEASTSDAIAFAMAVAKMAEAYGYGTWNDREDA